MATFYRVLLALVLACSVAEARICFSMDIRSVKTQFDQLKNCTKIIGYLKIVLLEADEKLDSFPDLVEVTGYVMVFLVPALTSLGDLFPNLVVIRGNILLKDAALIVYNNENMTKLGLSNLLEIQRGTVVVMHCPKLCYLNTIDWNSLGTSLNSFLYDLPKCPQEKCPHNCHGYCWSSDKCQKFYKDCHPQCLGCSKPNSANHCIVCKHFKDGNTCVERCPPNKYKNEAAFTCHTKEECKMLPKDHFTYKDQCLRKCPKIGNKKYKEAYIETEKTCVPCVANECTSKRICNGILVESASDIENLHGCTHIMGHLELKLSDPSLIDMLESNLGEIQEIEGCLRVARSSALTSLNFLKYLKKIKGKYRYPQCNGYAVFVYENTNLQKLWDFDNFSMVVDNATIGFHDNPMLCLSQIEEFARKIGIQFKNIEDIENADVSPTSNGDKATCNVIDMETTIKTNNPTNVTLCWDIKTMNNLTFVGYTVFFTPNISQDTIGMDLGNTCGKTQWMSEFVSNKCHSLNNLHPFTTYHYYIKVYSTLKVEGSSILRNFTTLAFNPSLPEKLEITEFTSSSLNLTWLPPKFINGILSHFVLLATEEDYNSANDRDYCKNPLQTEPVKPPVLKKVKRSNDTCKCRKEKYKPDDSCDNMWDDLDRNCKNYLYGIAHLQSPKEEMYDLKNTTNENSIRIIIPPNVPSFNLQGLKHFTTYVLNFYACNKDLQDQVLCSRSLFIPAKTLSHKSADNITHLKIKVQDRSAIVTWRNPVAPNGVIVSYNLENKVDGYTDGIVHIPQCFTTQDQIYKLQDLDPGSYSLRIKAISLAGPGFYTPYVHFEISRPLRRWVVYSSLCLGFVILTSICLIYIWYRHKVNIDDIRLIASINPDYESALYLEDSWELDRKDVEIKEEIGKGTFGLVYNGYIKSQRKICAIKTLNETALLSSRTSFLNEASVMKSFSEANHVVKLYGVVSRGDPPLVVMELMERGDLKQYLRNSRESSHTITSTEMYRMAIQIADGMTYLSAKKYVHRDLAARNCMVGHDYTVKIGDFGMTRDVYETDYYKKGTKGLLPVRWMAPESLADGIFTSESDVWSFGIVLWEIITLAEQPYQGMANEQVLNFVISRGKLNRPLECPDLMFEIMDPCWTFHPKHRPLFTEIVEKLEHLAGPSFHLESFYHSREGTEYRLNIRPREIVQADESSSFEDEHFFFNDQNFFFVGGSLKKRATLMSSFN